MNHEELVDLTEEEVQALFDNAFPKAERQFKQYVNKLNKPTTEMEPETITICR